MKIANIVREGRSHIFDSSRGTRRDLGGTFTPGQFFREAGTLIALCLALGLLMSVLLR